MSIKNLLTDSSKPDQILNINNTNTSSYGFYSQAFSDPIVVAVNTSCGFIEITNWTDAIVSEATKPMTILTEEIVDSTAIVLVCGVTFGNSNERKLRFSINTISTGQFTVDITNTSTTDFAIGSSARYFYIILHS